MYQVKVNLCFADIAVGHRFFQIGQQHFQIEMVHVKQHLDIVTELASQAGGKTELVYQQNQQDCRRHIEKPQFHGQALGKRKRRHGQRKTGDENRMDPGAGSFRVHPHHHQSGQDKMGRGAGENKKEKMQNDTSGDGAGQPGFHPVCAVFVHGTQQDKGVEHQPVAVFRVYQAVVEKSDGQYQTKPQGKPHLKGVRLQTVFQLIQRQRHIGLLPVPLRFLILNPIKVFQQKQKSQIEILGKDINLFFSSLGCGQQLAALRHQNDPMGRTSQVTVSRLLHKFGRLL